MIRIVFRRDVTQAKYTSALQLGRPGGPGSKRSHVGAEAQLFLVSGERPLESAALLENRAAVHRPARFWPNPDDIIPLSAVTTFL